VRRLVGERDGEALHSRELVSPKHTSPYVSASEVLHAITNNQVLVGGSLASYG